MKKIEHNFRIALALTVTSHCRLCLLRSDEFLEPLVEVTYCANNKFRFNFYCADCYSYLRNQAGSFMTLPETPTTSYYNLLVDPWLIKEFDCLRIFYPSDEIDLGLYRQTLLAAKKLKLENKKHGENHV